LRGDRVLGLEHNGSRCFAVSMCLLMVAGAFLVVPSGGGVGVVAAADPVIMTVGVTQTPDSLNVFAMTLSISYTINFLVYDTLNSVDENLNPGPQLAASWESNVDGTVWTYHLQEGALWHDGVEVTADDVAYTFNLIMDNPTEGALWGGYLEGFEPVVAVDKYTVQITTDVPKATMLSIMVPILPEHIWSLIPTDKIDDLDPWDSQYFPDGPIGSGPLMLYEYSQTAGFIDLLKWDQYYLDTVNVDEILYKIFKTDDAMMTALYSGTIDVATGVPARVWDETLSKPDISGQAVKSLSIFELGINCAPEEMRNKADFPTASDNLETCNLAVRQAIALAVNKTEIVNEILMGLAEEGESVISTATAYWHYNVTAEEEFAFNLEEARTLLDDAGYIDIDDDDIRENSTSGVELTFDFYYRSEKVDDQLAAGMITDWLADIGINAPAQGVTENSLYNLWYQCRYDMYIWAWDFDVDPSFALSVMTTDEIPDDATDFTAWSDCFYTNPVYDALYLQQLNTPDMAERQAIIYEMQQILYRDCPYVVLWYPFGLHAYRTDRFCNFPDMVSHPGMTPGTMWYFFEVTLIGENAPPTDVDAGNDQTVYLGETLGFTGNATDLNDGTSTLNWTWTFDEPDSSSEVLYGRTVSYTFLQIGTVDVTLKATDPGGLNGTDSLVVEVTELPDNVGWLIGYVTDGSTAPIAGAEVLIGTLFRTTYADGYYSAALLPGDYDVSASAAGYSEVSDSVTISENSTVWLNFTLEATTGTLTGHIYDGATGDSIAFASVVLMLPTTNTTVMTNAEGFFEFTFVAPGTYTLNATARDYESNSTTVIVAAGETMVQDMDLAPEVDDSSSGGGLSLAVVAGICIAVAAVVAAALLMLKRKKKTDVFPPPPAAP